MNKTFLYESNAFLSVYFVETLNSLSNVFNFIISHEKKHQYFKNSVDSEDS